MNIENLSDSETKNLESEIAARRGEVDPAYQHYGSVENLSDSETKNLESEIAARRGEVKPAYQHSGSVENLSDADLRALEAQVAEQRKNDTPHKEYLDALIDDPDIINENDFKQAVMRSMQSNRIMRRFVEALFEKVSTKSYELRKVDKNDENKIKEIKIEIEKLMSIYQKFMYTLKENDWNFNDTYSLKLPEDIKEDLWKLEKNFDITFTLSIPGDLGNGKFAQEGRMIPILNAMYDHLNGKEVNWYQTMIYNQNKFTMHQQNQQNQEERRRQFEEIRKQEINNSLSKLNDNILEEGAKHL